MMQHTFTPFEVAQFISDEITSGASLAKKALMKNIKNAGSVSKNRLQYLTDGVIRDMILVNGVRHDVEISSVEEVQILTEVIPSESKNLILDEPVEDKPKRKRSTKKTVINEESVQ